MTTIVLILQALSALMNSGILGTSAAAVTSKVVPIIDTIASLASLPDQFEPQRQALLAQVQSWVTENREPTDDELAAIQSQRDDLFAQAEAARAALG